MFDSNEQRTKIILKKRKAGHLDLMLLLVAPLLLAALTPPRAPRPTYDGSSLHYFVDLHEKQGQRDEEQGQEWRPVRAPDSLIARGYTEWAPAEGTADPHGTRFRKSDGSKMTCLLESGNKVRCPL